MEDSCNDAGSSKVDTLMQSDDIRTADMDISDDGENFINLAVGGGAAILFTFYLCVPF